MTKDKDLQCGYQNKELYKLRNLYKFYTSNTWYTCFPQHKEMSVQRKAKKDKNIKK